MRFRKTMTKIRRIILVSVVCTHIIVTPIEAQEQYNNIRHLIREEVGKQYSEKFILEEDLDTLIKSNLDCEREEEYYKVGFKGLPNKHVSNGARYNWYINQHNTGIHSSNNCIPSTLEMAMLWSNKENTVNAKDIRDLTRPAGGWLYSEDIMNILNKYNINYIRGYVSRYSDNLNALKEEIDKGSIALAVLDFSKISMAKTGERVGKSYDNGITGHSVIIKGYLEVEDKTFVEVYDPNYININKDMDYLDKYSTYLSMEDLNKALKDWSNYYYVIKNSIEI